MDADGRARSRRPVRVEDSAGIRGGDSTHSMMKTLMITPSGRRRGNEADGATHWRRAVSTSSRRWLRAIFISIALAVSSTSFAAPTNGTATAVSPRVFLLDAKYLAETRQK